MSRAVLCLLLLALAVPAQEAALSFPRHLDAQHTTLLAIADPYPHLEALLRSERLKSVLEKGRLGRALRTVGAPLDPMAWLRQVAAVKQYIPSEIAVGITEEGLLDLSRLIEAMVAIDLVMIGGTAEDADVLAGIPPLRTKALDLLRSARAPRCTLFVRFRGEIAARAIWQQIGVALTGLAGEGFEVEPLRDGWKVAFRMRTLGEETISLWAEVLAGEGASEDDLRAFSKAIEAIEIEARIERIGDGLKVRLGAPVAAAAGGLDPSSLGPLCRFDRETVLFGHWRTGGLRARAKRFREEMERLRATPFGRYHATADDTGILDTFLDAARTIERTGDVGALRVWADGALHLRAEERGAAPAAPLEPVLRALPADAEIVAADGSRSVAGLLAAFVLGVEDRLTTQSLREGWEGGDKSAMEEKYYESFAPFRDALFTDLPKGFLPPSAVVATSRGRLERLSVRAKGRRAASVEGGAFPEVAVLGRVTGSDALRLLSTSYVRLAEGIAAVAGAKSDIRAARLKAADLSLGARTFVLDGAWLRDLLAEKAWAVEIEGDFLLHAVQDGELLILSSSPRLSRAILAAHRGDGPRLELAAGAPGTLVASGKVPGRTLSSWLDRSLDVVALALDPSRPERTPGSDLIRDALVGIADLLDEVTWRVVDERGVRVTEAHVTFPK